MRIDISSPAATAREREQSVVDVRVSLRKCKQPPRERSDPGRSGHGKGAALLESTPPAPLRTRQTGAREMRMVICIFLQAPAGPEVCSSKLRLPSARVY